MNLFHFFTLCLIYFHLFSILFTSLECLDPASCFTASCFTYEPCCVCWKSRGSPLETMESLRSAEVAALPEFQCAKWIKVNPDSPQIEARHWDLRLGKWNDISRLQIMERMSVWHGHEIYKSIGRLRSLEVSSRIRNTSGYLDLVNYAKYSIF